MSNKKVVKKEKQNTKTQSLKETKELTHEEKEILKYKYQATEIINYNDYEEENVEFIFFPYIPKGKLVIAYGDPGSTKSLNICNIASIISNGGLMPLTNEKVEQRKVVLQCYEDGIKDTLKPRLKAFGANFSNIITLNEKGCYTSGKNKGKSRRLLLDDLNRIELILKRYKPLLFVIDPIQSYLPKGINMNVANDMRKIFDPLIELAEKYSCTFIIVMHTNKGDSKSMDKIMGSRDMTAAPRSVIRFGINPNNKEEILVEHVKSSLSAKGKSFACKVISENNKIKGIDYLGYRDYMSFDDFENNSTTKERPIDFAKKWLLTELAYGGVDSNIVKEKATKLDISSATLNRAKEDLKISSLPKGKNRDWVLPTKSDNLKNKDCE